VAASTRLVGVDVGGSSIKLGAAGRDGRILLESTVEVRGRGTGEILDSVAAEVLRLGAGTPAALGVGVPGLLERAEGRVLASPNLPWLDGVGVRDELARRLDLPAERVIVENDANVAALGELWRGAAREARHALIVTLGTGIGGGLILDGRLFVGEGLAGEIGHVTIDPAGVPCGCGSFGCLETLASA
jgi:glucokinase